MSSVRPPHFPPGTPIGDWYSVEGLVRLCEGRMFYLVNDVRPDQDRKRCWSCGDETHSRGSRECGSCGSPFEETRFLMSCRWNKEFYDLGVEFYKKNLEHPGLATPTDIIRHEDQLLSFVPYRGEGLMIDEASPLSNQRILDVAQRVAGTLAFLQVNGVAVHGVTAANLLVSPDGQVRLFDLDVTEVDGEPLDGRATAQSLASAADLLRRFCNVEADALADFMNTVGAGDYPTPMAFGRAVEKRFDNFSAVSYPPRAGAMSDVGLTRQLNEDYWGWLRLTPSAWLYVVADGMGGHEGGEVASSLAVETLCGTAREAARAGVGDSDQTERLLDDAFQTANNRVKEEAEARGNDMGTTLVAMLLDDQRRAFVANVGDSRAYMHRAGRLIQISVDHSLVQKMVERGKITAEEARSHPHSNILLRTVGTERDVEIELFRRQMETDDLVLLCSDGLWGEVEDRDMESILNTYRDPRVAVRELVRAAHHGGGKDNVSLLLVRVP